MPEAAPGSRPALLPRSRVRRSQPGAVAGSPAPLRTLRGRRPAPPAARRPAARPRLRLALPRCSEAVRRASSRATQWVAAAEGPWVAAAVAAEGPRAQPSAVVPVELGQLLAAPGPVTLAGTSSRFLF